MWSGGRSETTDIEVIWPHGANERGKDDKEGVCE